MEPGWLDPEQWDRAGRIWISIEPGWQDLDLNGTGLAGSGSQWNRAGRIRMSMNWAG